MGWIEYFRFSRFKYMVLGISFVLLEVIYWIWANELFRCNPETNICYTGWKNLLLYNFTSILPILIAIYLLLCLGEFIYRLYIRLKEKEETG